LTSRPGAATRPVDAGAGRGGRAEPAGPRTAPAADAAPALDALGLSPAAERTYRTLLAAGPATPAELAARLRADVVTVAGALAELAALDLAVPDRGDVADAHRCWRAESPELALAALMARQQEALLRRQRELERAQAAVGELVRVSRARSRRAGADAVDLVADPAEVTRRARGLARIARESVYALDRLPGDGYPAPGDGYAAPGGVTEALALVDPAVDVLALYEQSALAAPGRFDAVRGRAGDRQQVRTVPALPLTLAVFDRTTAVVWPGQDDRDPAALVVHPSPLLSGLLGLFELLWDRAVPLPGRGDEPPREDVDASDQLLVALLAAGFKDESIARHLGISTSTVTRRMARLMERTGASTRFQLGMQAVRRQWV
jgi:predicted transcriptional regulator